MRVSSLVSSFISRWCPSRAGRLLSAVAGVLLIPALAAAATAPPKAAETIAVLPEAPYYLYIAYETLIIFWVGILGLLIIIRMKLREIERTQALGADREEEDAPLLR